MRLFSKIYVGVFVPVIAVVYVLAYLASLQQVAALEERILEENRVVAAFMAKEIEQAQLTLKWPFAGLENLTQRPDFLFWWVVSEGTIHLAHDAAFMGTAPPSSLPPVDLSSSQPQIVVDRDRNYAVVVHPVRAPEKAMTFWLGFSLASVRQSRNRVLRTTAAVAVGALAVLAIALYVTVQRLMRPLQELRAGAGTVGGGDLRYRIATRTRDEIGDLVTSFNQMAESLQQTTVSKDYVNAILTELVDALIVFDMDGRIVTANRGALELLGYSESDLLGRSIQLVVPAEDAALRPAGIAAAGKMRNYETTYRRADGSTVPVLFGASVLRSASAPPYIVSTGRDISELKTLRGLIPICASCKKIRDDKGYWSQIELYIRAHSAAEFSHGICPECFERLYPEYKDE